MSTYLPKTNLSVILKYGMEALGNRYKDLFLIALVFILGPQIAFFLTWDLAASSAPGDFANLADPNLISQIERFMDLVSGKVLPATLLAAAVSTLGILALARSCVDYFESSPASMASVLKRALRVLISKGPGCILMLCLLMPFIAIMPLLRAVAISMLVMLPVTLVAGTKGGFVTTWNTVFLKYAGPTRFGRWPIFINVLAITGIFLTILFAVAYGIETLAVMDTILEVPANWLGEDVTLGGFSINAGRLMSEVVGILWESVALTVIIPFTAAIYHLSTVPDGHESFETTT